MKRILLDTHVWIWLSIADEKSLSDTARKAIADAKQKWIAAISLWELAKLVEKSRLLFTIPTLTWIKRSLHEIELRVADLTPEIAVDSTLLKGVHQDPADQIIVATARVLGMPLISADKRIHAYAQVEIIW